MKRKRYPRQGGLLALLEPGPALAPATQQMLVPMIAALLAEVATAEAKANSQTMVECCSASNPDPSGSCEINKLGSRSASNSRAGQQPGSGRVSAIRPEPLAVARSPRLKVTVGHGSLRVENGERRSGRRQTGRRSDDDGARVRMESESRCGTRRQKTRLRRRCQASRRHSSPIDGAHLPGVIGHAQFYVVSDAFHRSRRSFSIFAVIVSRCRLRGFPAESNLRPSMQETGPIRSIRGCVSSLSLS